MLLLGMVHGYEVVPDFVPWLLTLRWSSCCQAESLSIGSCTYVRAWEPVCVLGGGDMRYP